MPRYATVNAMLDDVLVRFAERPAFVCAGHRLSYRELDTLSRDFAAYLQQHLGLQPGERIALQLPNINQYPLVIFGAIRAGLVIVNTNPLYTPRELEHQLRDCGAKVLVVLANVAHTAAEIIRDTDVEHIIVTEFADLMPWPKRWLLNFAIKHLKHLVPPYHFAQATHLRQALSIGRPLQLSAPPITPETLLCLQYTGGTTGVAKGAMLSHANLCSNAWQVITHTQHLRAEDREIFIAPLPIYHIYAFCLHILGAVSLGACSVLIPNPRDIPATIAAIRPHRFSVFVGINTLFRALVHDEAFKTLDFSGIKSVCSGGMALTSDIAAKWQTITGHIIDTGYGLTEASPVVSGCCPGAYQAGTIGILVPETQAKILDEQGVEVARGEAGELCIKGPQVMLGYWQKPAETAAVLSADGWLKTGDIAIYQTDGFLKLVDRKKDMVNVSGFNVYPNEVEDVICQCPGVLEAAVVGVTDDKTGEAVKLFVVAKDPGLTAEAIRQFCRGQLTAYKVPKYIEFRSSLPKSNVGKIIRRALRDENPPSHSGVLH